MWSENYDARRLLVAVFAAVVLLATLALLYKLEV